MSVRKKTLPKQDRPAGEPYVWLCSLGLSIGLLMVCGLLAVIVVNGLKVFWPKQVVQVEISPGSHFDFMGHKTLAGELVKKQEKISPDRGTASSAAPPTEWQLYVGNKDVYGAAFVYLDQDVIASTNYPPEIMRLERMEYGNAIGYPVAVMTRVAGRLLLGLEPIRWLF